MESNKVVSYFIIILIATILVSVLATVVSNQASSNDLKEEHTASLNQTILSDNGTATTLTLSQGSATITSLAATRHNQTWLDFDGVDDYMFLNSNVIPLMQPHQNYSFFSWIKTEKSGIENIFGGATPTAVNRTQLYVQSKLRLTVGGTGTNTNIFINRDKWFFVGYVSEYNGSNYISKIYLDGVPVGSLINNISRGFNDEVRIGKRTTVEFFNGSMDSINFFNYSLNQSEINYLYEDSVLSQENDRFVPIMYGHGIGGDGFEAINLTVFEAIINYTNYSGYIPVSINQIRNLSLNQIVIDKPVSFIFDDGYKDVFQNGSVVLNEYDFNVSLAIVTNRTNSATINSTFKYLELYNIMNWTNIINLSSEGYEIISHSFSHQHMLNINVEERVIEFNQSRWDIFNNISIMPNVFIFPFNEQNSTLISECLNYYEICSGFDGNGYFILNNQSLSNGDFNRFNLIKSTTTLNKFIEYIDVKNYSAYNPINYLNLKLNENSGTTAYDTSGNSNNGTITGATWNNDGVLIALTNLIDYTLVGNVFTVINNDLSWEEIKTSYSDRWYTTFGFHITIMNLVAGFVCLSLLTLVVLYLLKIYDERENK